mgnify:CR=1 FL=1
MGKLQGLFFGLATVVLVVVSTWLFVERSWLTELVSDRGAIDRSMWWTLVVTGVVFIATNLPVTQAMGLPIAPLPVLMAVDAIPDVLATVGNVTADMFDPYEHYRRAQAAAEKIFAAGAVLITLGGDHGVL